MQAVGRAYEAARRHNLQERLGQADVHAKDINIFAVKPQ
jgi:hypothetical protein